LLVARVEHKKHQLLLVHLLWLLLALLHDYHFSYRAYPSITAAGCVDNYHPYGHILTLSCLNISHNVDNLYISHALGFRA